MFSANTEHAAFAYFWNFSGSPYRRSFIDEDQVGVYFCWGMRPFVGTVQLRAKENAPISSKP